MDLGESRYQVVDLFFSADDGMTGRELWKTDGTEAGTYLVADLNPTDESGRTMPASAPARRLDRSTAGVVA